jgi:hypothetical protein
MDGNAKRLAEDIPKGDVDAADPADPKAAPAQIRKDMAPVERKLRPAAVIHHVPKATDPARILADDQRPQFLLDDRVERKVRTGARQGGARLAVTDDTAFGLDADECRIEGFDAAEIGTMLPVFRDRRMQPVGGYGFDFHIFSLTFWQPDGPPRPARSVGRFRML